MKMRDGDMSVIKVLAIQARRQEHSSYHPHKSKAPDRFLQSQIEEILVGFWPSSLSA